MTKITDAAEIMLPAEMRVLFFEPNTVAYLGLLHILSLAGVKREHQRRVRNVADINSTLLHHFPADVLLLSTGCQNEYLTELLGFLSANGEPANRRPVFIRMGTFTPVLLRLLMSFGADGVLPPDCSALTLLHSLRMAPEHPVGLKSENLLTPRERLVIRQILSGYSLMQIAQQLRLDIRTVSGYRQQAALKLRMNQPNELRLLAQRLSRVGCPA